MKSVLESRDVATRTEQACNGDKGRTKEVMRFKTLQSIHNMPERASKGKTCQTKIRQQMDVVKDNLQLI